MTENSNIREERKEQRRKAGSEKNKNQPSLLGDLLFLIIKIAVISLFLVIIFTFFFGIIQIKDNSMEPALRDGDLAIYYRLEKNYVQNDLITVIQEGKTTIRRVIAIEGDKVDINKANGLEINGFPQQEDLILGETLPVVEGTTFSVDVGMDQVFVLGDNREYSVDSRTYGCVDKADTHGRVITVIRRRNL